MKPLDKLNNIEKASLLHQLFPGEISAFIEFMQGVCDTLLEQQEEERAKWNNGIMSFDYWLSLVKEAGQIITTYGGKLSAKRALFTDQLFDGMQASYTVYCLTLYIKTKRIPNSKFAQAIDLLFL